MTLRSEQRRLLSAAFGGHELTVTRLSGGLHGRCYRVSSPSFDYAVRMPAGDEGPHRLGCHKEQRVLARAAAAGLGPAVAPTDPGLGLVATRYLAGARPWSVADARQPVNIDRIARRLKCLHASDLAGELEPFGASGAAATYAGIVTERHALSPEQQRWRGELIELARRFDAVHRSTAPCHNDLVASNVLDDGELWLVDFEYAVLSAPLLDLAGLAGFNGYDREQQARLIAAYYGDAPAPFDTGQLEATIRLLRLLAYFWSLAYQRPGSAGKAFSAFADVMAAMLR